MGERMRFFWVVLAASSFFVDSAFSGTVEPANQDKSRTWVGFVSAGPVWANASQMQSLYVASQVEKTYVAKDAKSTLPVGELFIGVQENLGSNEQNFKWLENTRWIGQLGLLVATTGDTKLQGEIWDDTSPQFNNFSYEYQVRNTRISLQGKLLFDHGSVSIPWVYFTPWINASLGIGFNQAHDFENTPLIFEALPNPNFSRHTTTALTYTVGAGVQKILDRHCQIGIAYEFADWGKSALGRAPGQTTHSGLVLNHLYTNGFLLNFTYLV